MPATSSAPGSKPQAVKRPKAKPKRAPEPVVDVATAIASGTERPHRKAKRLPPEVVAEVTDKSIKEVRKAHKAYKRATKKAAKDIVRADPGTVEQAIGRFKDPVPKSHDIFVNDQGKPERFSDYASRGTKFLNALTGHDPYASEGQQLLNVSKALAQAAAPIPVYKGAKAGQTLLRGERALNTASKAETAIQAAAKAKTARKVERAAARAKATTKTAKVKATAKTAAKQTRARASAPEVKAAAKRTAARRADRSAAAIANPAVFAASTSPGAVGDKTRAFLEGTAKAVSPFDKGGVGETLQTAKTTAAGIFGAPVAAVGDIYNVATGHGDKVVEEYKGYAKTVAKLASGDPEKVERVTTNKVGLIPAATVAGLGAKGVGAARRAAGKDKVRVKPRAEHKRDADIKKAAKGNEAAAQRLAENLYEPPRRQRRAQKREEAVRADITEQKRSDIWRSDMKAGGRKRLETEMAEAAAKKVSGNVREADIIRIVAAHGYKGPEAVTALKELRAGLKDSKRKVSVHARDTRKVIDALVERPDAIAHVQGLIDRFEEIQRRQSIRRHSERTGEHQTTPDPLDERARLLPVANELNEPLGENIIPRELEGKTNIKTRNRHGEVIRGDVEKRVRAAGRNAERKAARQRQMAEELERQGRADRAAVLRRRADQYETRAEAQLAVVDRHKRADKMEIEANRDLADGTITRDEFEAVRRRAEDMRAAQRADQAARSQEASRNLSARLDEEGRRQPIRLPQTDAGRRPTQLSHEQQVTARKEKRLTGSLEKQGRVDESGLNLMQQLHRERAADAEAERQAQFINATAKPVFPDGRRFGTQAEFMDALERGDVPIGTGWVSLQKFARARQRSGPLRKEIEAETLRVKGTAPRGERSVGMVVPRHNLQEFYAQSEQIGRTWQNVRKLMHAQSIAMLATSPTFMEFQMVATPLQIALRHQNPAAHIRAIRRAVDDFKHLAPEEKAGVRALTQSVSLDSLSVTDRAIGLDPTTIAAQNAGMRGLMGTPAGKLVRAVWENVKKGGPITRTVAKYEGALRLHNFYLELDRAAGTTLKGTPRASARVRGFMEGVSRGAVQQQKLLKKLDGMKPHEQTRYLLSRQGATDQAMLLETIRDNLGNYGAMTKTERELSSLIPFYGFFRASLHTMAAFPKHNPIKAAILANLGAQNQDQLKHIFGGDPGFFSQFGQTVVYGSDDKRRLLDLSRALPGGNAALELVGNVADEGLNLQNLLRLTQPIVGITAGALDRKTSSGLDAPQDESQLELFLEGVSGLNPITRKYLKDHIGPDPSKFSELYRAINAADPTEGAFSNSSWYLPDLTDQPKVMQDSVRLSKLLETAFKVEEFPSPSQIPVKGPEHDRYVKAKKEADKAWDEIDAMLVAYGVQTKAQQKREAKKASERTSVNQWGNKPSKPKARPKTPSDSIFSSGGEPIFDSASKGDSIFSGSSGQPIFK